MGNILSAIENELGIGVGPATALQKLQLPLAAQPHLKHVIQILQQPQHQIIHRLVVQSHLPARAPAHQHKFATKFSILLHSQSYFGYSQCILFSSWEVLYSQHVILVMHQVHN